MKILVIVLLLLSSFRGIAQESFKQESFKGKVNVLDKEAAIQSRITDLEKMITPLTFSVEQKKQLTSFYKGIGRERKDAIEKYRHMRDTLNAHMVRLAKKQNEDVEKIFTKEQLQNYKAYQEKQKAEAQKYIELLNQRRGMLKEE